MDILATIKASPELRKLADTGQDAILAAAITDAMPKPKPVTVQALMAAAPQTLTALKTGTTARADLIEIGKMVSGSDLAGMSIWAMSLLMLGTMPQSEHDAVMGLIAGAAPVESVSLDQVQTALNAVRPRLPELTGPLFYMDSKSEVDESGVITGGTPILDENGVQRIGVTRHERIDGGSPIDWSKVD